MVKDKKKSDTVREYRACSHEFVRQKSYLEDRYTKLPPHKNFISLHESQMRDLISVIDTFFQVAEAMAEELRLTQHLCSTSLLNQRLQDKLISKADELEAIRQRAVKGESSFEEFQEKLKEFVDAGN